MERSGSLLVKMVPNNLAEVYYKLHQNQDFFILKSIKKHLTFYILNTLLVLKLRMCNNTQWVLLLDDLDDAKRLGYVWWPAD